MTMLVAGVTETERQFQEKMKDRIRTAMGDLMPDDVLAGIVGRGIEEAFFKKQVRPDLRWGGTTDYPSWLIEHMQSTMKERIKEQIERWFADHHERVAEIVKETLQGGIVAAVSRSAEAIFRDTLSNFEVGLTRKLDEIRQRE